MLSQFTFGLSDKDKTFQFAPTILNKYFFLSLTPPQLQSVFFLCVINVIVLGDINQGYVDNNLKLIQLNSLDSTEKNIF